jgi:osmotically inducible lipoprotein OsmB
MKRARLGLAIVGLSAFSLSACTTTQERVGGAGTGAVAGAAVAGPVGAVVGGVAGAITGPTVAAATGVPPRRHYYWRHYYWRHGHRYHYWY